jgi:hypothetical protein
MWPLRRDAPGCPRLGEEPKLPAFIDNIAPMAERGKFVKSQTFKDPTPRDGGPRWAYVTYSFENIMIYEGSFNDFGPYQYKIEWKGRKCAEPRILEAPAHRNAICQSVQLRILAAKRRGMWYSTPASMVDIDFEGQVTSAAPLLDVLIERVHGGPLVASRKLKFQQRRVDLPGYPFERGRRYRFKLRGQPFEVIPYPTICEDIQPLPELAP